MDPRTDKLPTAAPAHACGFLLAAAAAIMLLAPVIAQADDATVTLPPAEHAGAAGSPPEAVQGDLDRSPEKRFVAPTDRDRIGRIWAPVSINNKGPFRLVLDTGATNSAVTAEVALALGLPLTQSDQVILHGVTGSTTVPTIAVDAMVVGDLELPSRRLPIVANALGGAEGILGTDGLLDKRITIDFRNDSITIARSNYQRAGFGFITVPFRLVDGLAIIDARIGNVRAKAIIDTGGQSTIGNVALRDSLVHHYSKELALPDEIVGITLDVQAGKSIDTPTIMLGKLALGNVRVTIGDMDIFKHWHMTREPVVLIGMDVLGLFDTLIIDYLRKEMQIRLVHGS
jgi:hypothetical protein